MSVPSFDPDDYLNLIGYKDTTGQIVDSTFSHQYDPSVDPLNPALGPFSASITPTSLEYAGLKTEWDTRTILGTGTFEEQMTALFKRWDPAYTNVSQRLIFPRTLNDFIQQFRANFGIPNTSPGAAYTGFLTQFRTTLRADYDLNPELNSVVNQEFEQSFAGFLNSYPSSKVIQTVGGTEVATYTAPNLSIFINNWRHFTTVVAAVKNSTVGRPGYNTTLQNFTDYADLLTYEDAYKAFFPNATAADFTNTLQAFVAEVNADTKDGGYFVPSQMYDRFFEEMKNRFLVQQATQGTMLANSGPKLAILWSLFFLILEMIQSIQKVTAIEAQRLGYLTNYQKAYTELISQIPTLTNGQPFSSSFTGTANAKLQAFAENLRSFRGVQTDESKGLQSSVNGLNESGNQQANLATDLLQQMSSLLSTIMK